MLSIGYELTKTEKRISRELIQRGLERECTRFIGEMRNLVNETREDVHAHYIDIYRKTKSFDKHVAWRYDGMTGSKYLHCVASLVSDKILSDDEIVGYSEEIRERIFRMAGRRNTTDIKASIGDEIGAANESL